MKESKIRELVSKVHICPIRDIYSIHDVYLYDVKKYTSDSEESFNELSTFFDKYGLTANIDYAIKNIDHFFLSTCYYFKARIQCDYPTLDTRRKNILNELYFDDLFELIVCSEEGKTIRHINKRLEQLNVE